MSTLSRVRAMSFDEIRCRSRQQIRCWIDGIRPAFGPAGEPIRGWSGRARRERTTPSRDQLRQAMSCRFFPGVADSSWLAPSPGTFAWQDRVIADANAVLDGRFDILGYSGVSFGQPIDWHLDPVSGRRAPLIHWSRINPLDPAAVGDSKVIWELNRHQWMVTLAEAWWMTGDERYARAGLDRLDEWTAANPYPFGINWTSSLEVSFRLISWLWALALFREAPALTDDRLGRWLTLAAAHASHVERYLSHYYSPNTHLTGEALGLVYAGVVLAETADAARWRDVGRRILLEELGRQVGTDGIHVEQATCYQRYTADFYLHFLILANRNGLMVPEDISDRVAAVVGGIVGLMRPDGHMLDIGDADGGWLLPFVKRDPLDARGTLALAAAVLQHPEFAWACDAESPEVAWCCGREGTARVNALSPTAPRDQSAALDASGYVAMRSGWDRDSHLMVFDAGPLGGAVSAGHGHADLLSIQCVAFGEPVLVDPGTGSYTGDRGARRHFRSSYAHNTVLVDGAPHAEPAGPFSWREQPTAVLEAWHSTASYDIASGAYIGHRAMGEPIVHRRRVVFLKPSVWIVVDDVEAEGTHEAEIRWQFSPRAVTRREGGWLHAGLSGGAALWVYVTGSFPIENDLREGRPKPLDGWVSPAYGTRVPAPLFLASGLFRNRGRFVTVVVAERPAGGCPPRFHVDVGSSGSTTVSGGENVPVVRVGMKPDAISVD